MAKPPRTRRRNGADWVYRSTVWDTAAGALDDLGTYTPVQKVLVAGIANANFGALYDSFNYARGSVTAGAQAFDAPRIRIYGPARAEGKNAFIHRVEGQIILTPSVWGGGSVMLYGCRFGIFEQDAAVGGVLIDPTYSMWSVTAAHSPACILGERPSVAA